MSLLSVVLTLVLRWLIDYGLVAISRDVTKPVAISTWMGTVRSYMAFLITVET